MKKLTIVIIISIAVIALYLIQQEIRLLVVMSESMEPQIKKGSIVLTKKDTKYSRGDIISYRTDNKNSFITHRISNIEKVGNKYLLTTKGDNNDNDDPKPICKEDIGGKVIANFSFSDIFEEYLLNIFVLLAGFSLSGFIFGKILADRK